MSDNKIEIQSFELAGKPTDSNFVYYNICVRKFNLQIEERESHEEKI